MYYAHNNSFFSHIFNYSKIKFGFMYAKKKIRQEIAVSHELSKKSIFKENLALL